ncbi:MAG: dynamin family protein [Chitinispirillaceae bacterium]|nr:dynamin family protein [Chitinispirillaceae bacterium]
MINLMALNEKILTFYEEAKSDGLIPETEFEEKKNRLHQDKATISIMGQVKAGKSTLINALFFEKDILPVSSIPMTAVLTELVYSEDNPEKAEIEFLSEEDWNNILSISQDKVEDSFWTQEARNIVKSVKNNLKSELKELLGGRREIDLNELKHYVTADGKYSPLVKKTKVYLKENILKSFNIVDTPGVNDPVLSREKKSLEFISKSDVVILVINSNRAFDEADSLLITRLHKVGVGKLIIVANKIDDILSEKENIEKIKKRIVEELNKKIKETLGENRNNYTVEVLAEARDNVICVSSLWEILSKYSIQEIEQDENYKWYYDRAVEILQNNGLIVNTPSELKEKSGFSHLRDEISKILRKGVAEIKLEKNKNYIIGLYNRKIDEMGIKKNTLESEREFISKTLDELIEEKKKLEELIKEIEEILIKSEMDIGDEFRKRWEDIRETIIEKSVRDNKEIADSLLESIKKEMAFRPIIFNIKKWIDRVNLIVKNKEKGAKEQILKHWKEFIRTEIESFRIKFEHLMQEINEKAKYSLGISYKTFREYYQIFNTKIREEKGDRFYQIDLNFTIEGVETDWSFLSRSNFITMVTEKVTKNIENAEKNLISQLKEIRKEIQKFYEEFFTRIKQEVLKPVEESLMNAINNLSKREIRKEEIDDEILKLESYINSLKEKLSKIDKELVL